VCIPTGDHTHSSAKGLFNFLEQNGVVYEVWILKVCLQTAALDHAGARPGPGGIRFARFTRCLWSNSGYESSGDRHERSVQQHQQQTGQLHFLKSGQTGDGTLRIGAFASSRESCRRKPFPGRYSSLVFALFFLDLKRNPCDSDLNARHPSQPRAQKQPCCFLQLRTITYR
jgi:hypothetical protein